MSARTSPTLHSRPEADASVAVCVRYDYGIGVSRSRSDTNMAQDVSHALSDADVAQGSATILQLWLWQKHLPWSVRCRYGTTISHGPSHPDMELRLFARTNIATIPFWFLSAGLVAAVADDSLKDRTEFDLQQAAIGLEDSKVGT